MGMLGGAVESSWIVSWKDQSFSACSIHVSFFVGTLVSVFGMLLCILDGWEYMLVLGVLDGLEYMFLVTLL